MSVAYILLIKYSLSYFFLKIKFNKHIFYYSKMMIKNKKKPSGLGIKPN